MRTGRRAVVATVLVAAATGCGLPGDRVEHIDKGSVPFGLLDTASPLTASPEPRGPHTSVYFVSQGRLDVAFRRVIGANVPAEALRLLLDGPTSDESAQGLATDVPTQTRLVSLDLAGRVATVDLSAEFGTVGGSDQVLAVAQIVYTLTESRYIDAVRFSINGRPVEVPDDSGSLSSVPRMRRDYRTVGPAASP